MDMNRRLLAGATLALAAAPAFAAPSDVDVVTKGLEAFRTAQVARDAKALDALCAPELSYSHSDGHIEDKAVFITNATSPKSQFISLEYRDPSVRVVGDAAIVRFHWVGQSQTPAGKVSDTNLHILMVWQKQHSHWKLLARCSTKL